MFLYINYQRLLIDNFKCGFLSITQQYIYIICVQTSGQLYTQLFRGSIRVNYGTLILDQACAVYLYTRLIEFNLVFGEQSIVWKVKIYCMAALLTFGWLNFNPRNIFEFCNNKRGSWFIKVERGNAWNPCRYYSSMVSLSNYISNYFESASGLHHTRRVT